MKREKKEKRKKKIHGKREEGERIRRKGRRSYSLIEKEERG